MKIYLVRHGETQWNKGEIFRGTKDIPLNEIGIKQAQSVGNYFSQRPVNRIISSPLARAAQTAESISMTTGIKIETMKEFTDMNFGIWEGLKLREVEQRFPADLNRWKTSPEKLQIEGGETLDMVRDRISSGLANILYGTEDTIIIISHRVICKMLVLHALRIGNDHFWDMRYDPASITLLEWNNGRHALIFCNDTCQLESNACRDF
jgi:broad specificity phosphatase PhoE